ncbi:uncharacterized protein LOC118280895 [Spodoptera frugiperda]|uniref:Uncharacterized protein LOC118280895 n=1 Tax=Spodoptera frugiperda TaxID=7108 RepID=A0A9R0E0F6_SPOFR|nr:uncharacterized protein LOC118280895 [Spodoptera frugiperda]
MVSESSVKLSFSRQQYAEIDFGLFIPQWYGDYFMILENDDGSEERFRALTIKGAVSGIEISRLRQSVDLGGKLEKTLTYTCKVECELTDIVCKGDSAIPKGHIALIPSSKSININFPVFEEEDACVYLGTFRSEGKMYNKIVAVLESKSLL